MRDEQGRWLMWGWLREGRSVTAQRQVGWSGMMSLPRVLSIGDDDVLLMSPAPELAMLRHKEQSLKDVILTPNSQNLLAHVWGDALEILVEVELQPPTTFSLALGQTPEQAEQTIISYDAARQELAVDATESSLNRQVDRNRVIISHPLVEGNTLRLRIFVDASVIELFAKERTCVTTRVYPTRPNSMGVEIFTQNGPVRLKQVSLWQMQSIW